MVMVNLLTHQPGESEAVVELEEKPVVEISLIKTVLMETEEDMLPEVTVELDNLLVIVIRVIPQQVVLEVLELVLLLILLFFEVTPIFRYLN